MAQRGRTLDILLVGASFKSTGRINCHAPSNTDQGSQNSTVTAKVYNLAAPVIGNTQPINFGIVHVGDVITPVGLSIKNNAAAGSFSEKLNASFSPATVGVIATGGPISQLLAQSTDNTTLKVSIATTSNTVINGSVPVNFVSDGAGINSLGTTPLGSSAVSIIGQVNEFADPLFSKLLGAGTFTQDGPTLYTLNLGDVFVGDIVSTTLRLKNDNTAPGDDLAGTFATSGAQYLYTGFGPLTPIAAGGAFDSMVVALNTSTEGTFAGQIVLSGLSQNAAPFSGPLAGVTINITGRVGTVPEPTSLSLLIVSGMFLRRRSR